MENERNERNWYIDMPAIGVEYNDEENKDGLVTPVVWEGTAEEIEELQVETDVAVADILPKAEADEKGKALDISDLTAKEIDEKVESGELTAKQVYEAELAGKQRKGVLSKYEDDKGTTGEDE